MATNCHISASVNRYLRPVFLHSYVIKFICFSKIENRAACVFDLDAKHRSGMSSPQFWYSTLSILVSLSVVVDVQTVKDFDKACQHAFYCDSDIFATIQKMQLYNDSKHVADLIFKYDVNETLIGLNNSIYNVTDAQWVRSVLEDKFYAPGYDLASVNLSDWSASPPRIERFTNDTIKKWALHLNKLWLYLGKRTNFDAKEQDRHSLLLLNRSFIVPGGRFKEQYYWDTYWTVIGLLICGMDATARGTIENLLYMVEQYGFVLNGNRIYYERRSQPPFLTLMMEKYIEYTNDTGFMKDNLYLLDKEYSFWMNNRITHFRGHQFNIYSTNLGYERPEAFYTDYLFMEKSNITDEDERRRLFSEISSATESGWDFSSRWFNKSHNLNSMKTSMIIPVCLNSILCKVAAVLAKFHAGDNMSSFYQNEVTRIMSAIDSVLWNETLSEWFDYDLEVLSQNQQFYISNIFPLWAQCHNKSQSQILKLLNKYQNSSILQYQGGVPTSLVESREQWDFPNAWPPMQDIIHEAFKNSNTDVGKQLALRVAQKWAWSNYQTWRSTSNMFEKYSVICKPCSTTEDCLDCSGNGGEYEVQTGYAWTNGVILKFLEEYEQTLFE